MQSMSDIARQRYPYIIEIQYCSWFFINSAGAMEFTEYRETNCNKFLDWCEELTDKLNHSRIPMKHLAAIKYAPDEASSQYVYPVISSFYSWMIDSPIDARGYVLCNQNIGDNSPNKVITLRNGFQPGVPDLNDTTICEHCIAKYTVAQLKIIGGEYT